ncbi:MAG: GNAT family N-acetyltransferase, partial [Candidatus Nanopelagicaceae bacterium]|nr:GNAT family N-acetyltransferase [Candidatus Nanopelagicaceae bacterium]
MLEIRRLAEINSQESAQILSILSEAFEGEFSHEDWLHTFGGYRFLGFLNNQLIAHGAIVKRRIWVDSEELIVGYIEGIAVAPSKWRKGFGSALMEQISSLCKSEFSLSMLSTGEKNFYRKHGWLDFQGESYVLENGMEIRTEDEDEGLMLLPGLNRP